MLLELKAVRQCDQARFNNDDVTWEDHAEQGQGVPLRTAVSACPVLHSVLSIPRGANFLVQLLYMKIMYACTS